MEKNPHPRNFTSRSLARILRVPRFPSPPARRYSLRILPCRPRASLPHPWRRRGPIPAVARPIPAAAPAPVARTRLQWHGRRPAFPPSLLPFLLRCRRVREPRPASAGIHGRRGAANRSGRRPQPWRQARPQIQHRGRRGPLPLHLRRSLLPPARPRLTSAAPLPLHIGRTRPPPTRRASAPPPRLLGRRGMDKLGWRARHGQP